MSYTPDYGSFPKSAQVVDAPEKSQEQTMPISWYHKAPSSAFLVQLSCYTHPQAMILFSNSAQVAECREVRGSDNAHIMGHTEHHSQLLRFNELKA
jgi:hypothetical protein